LYLKTKKSQKKKEKTGVYEKQVRRKFKGKRKEGGVP